MNTKKIFTQERVRHTTKWQGMVINYKGIKTQCCEFKSFCLFVWVWNPDDALPTPIMCYSCVFETCVYEYSYGMCTLYICTFNFMFRVSRHWWTLSLFTWIAYLYTAPKILRTTHTNVDMCDICSHPWDTKSLDEVKPTTHRNICCSIVS